MSLITWACLRYVQELATILGPQNRTQGSCVSHVLQWDTYWSSWRSRRGRSWGPCCRTPRNPSADQSEMSIAAAIHQSQLTWTGSVSLVAATAAPAASAAVRAAEVAFIFSSSIYLLQKCRSTVYLQSSTLDISQSAEYLQFFTLLSAAEVIIIINIQC